MKLINDNRNLESWPEVIIVGSIDVTNLINDEEPFEQRLQLSCGHIAFNTYGYQKRKFNVNDKIRCKLCGEKCQNNT